jgi:hypothetical protein
MAQGIQQRAYGNEIGAPEVAPLRGLDAGFWFSLGGRCPTGAEAVMISLSLSAQVKSCPFKTTRA